VVSQTPAELTPSYKEFDKPASIRNGQGRSDAVSVNGGYDEEMLDIPAFLRRQAD